MKFKLKLPSNQYVPDNVLLDNLKKVAKELNSNTVYSTQYNNMGKYHVSTFKRRYGSWFNALKQAGLENTDWKRNIPEEKLFENLKNVWTLLERQPTRREIDTSISKYSASTYVTRFGSWIKALKAFIEYINQGIYSESKALNLSNSSDQNKSNHTKGHRTKRTISERMRFSILLRDGFTCKSCGRSPLKSPGVELHIDHIVPWSKGGETIADNLETKCMECNRGKGNAFSK